MSEDEPEPQYVLDAHRAAAARENDPISAAYVERLEREAAQRRAAEPEVNRISPPPPPPGYVRVPVVVEPAPSMGTIPPGWYPDPATGGPRWWTGTQWAAPVSSQPMPVVVVDKGVNHILHLLLSVVTAGFWIPVWIIVTLMHAGTGSSARPVDFRSNAVRGGIALGVILIIFIVVQLNL